MTQDEFIIKGLEEYQKKHSLTQRVSSILSQEEYNNKQEMFNLLDELVKNGYIDPYKKCQGPIITFTNKVLDEAKQ